MAERTQSNREALLEGALQCLQEKGYARTTARDIVAASGTNLGAIGYHYGSTERLLNAAVIEGFERWFREFAHIARGMEGADEPELLAKFAAEMPRTFERNRQFALAYVEALAQAERSEEVRVALAKSYEWARQSVAALIEEIARPAATPNLRVVASTLIAIFDGLLLQWLVDPTRTPTGTELLQTLGQPPGTGG
jgi:AcrR family transcriptional regulator